MIRDTASSAEELEENEKGLIARAAILKRWNVRNKHVLDIGAGLLAIIAARDFNCTVTTIDVAEDKLREVKHDVGAEGLAAQITVENEDATALSYSDGSFAVVISYGTLHHIEPADRMKLILEAHRVAKEMVIVAEVNADGFRKIHEFDDFTAVDLIWLESELNTLGDVDKYEGRLMNVYTLSFYKKEPVLRKSRTHRL
jgi:cyclopropane fatty-acyl-phospholipid synthase-like methyltransferase